MEVDELKERLERLEKREAEREKTEVYLSFKERMLSDPNRLIEFRERQADTFHKFLKREHIEDLKNEKELFDNYIIEILNGQSKNMHEFMKKQHVYV